MATMVATKQVHVHRDNKGVVVKPGESFNFTAEEVKELNAMGALREPKVEGGVSAKDASAFAKLVKTAEEATAKAEAKKDDKKLAEAAKTAAAAVREFAAEKGLEVPDSLPADGDL